MSSSATRIGWRRGCGTGWRSSWARTSFGYSDAMAQSMIDMDIAKEHGLDNGLERTPENTTPISFRQWAEEVLKPALDAR